MKTALSIDLEFWHSAELVRSYVQDGADLIVEMTTPILDLLDLHKTKATFFVLGKVAEKYPDLIKEIYDKGHEIASHSYSHRTLYDLGKDGFEREIDKSINLLENITGEKVKGFRAPTFSINNDTIWGLDVLEKFNFTYDSSVFPMKSFLYGVPNAPLHPYRPSYIDLAKEDESNERAILEIPPAICRFGSINIPVAGGFYLRSLPLPIVKALIKKMFKNSYVIMYFHPWELVPIAPKISLPLFSKFITYYNTNSTIYKLDDLLINFDFMPIERVADDFE